MSLYTEEEATQLLIGVENLGALAREFADRPISDTGDVLIQLNDRQRGQSAAPFVAPLADICGLIIYFPVPFLFLAARYYEALMIRL